MLGFADPGLTGARGVRVKIEKVGMNLQKWFEMLFAAGRTFYALIGASPLLAAGWEVHHGSRVLSSP